jgi:hypothetical protein
MVRRTKRRAGTAEQALASAVVARVSPEKGSATAAEVAVRGALARAEVDRPIGRIAVVPVGNAPFARVLGAALARDRDVRVLALDEAREVDGVFLVLPASTPPREAGAARDRVARNLLGVVLADDTAPARDVDAERLAELTHREVALRRLTEAVEQQRTELEERERALEERERSLDERAEERERALEERERAAQTQENAAAARPEPEDDGLGDRAAALEERERSLDERERARAARDAADEKRLAAAAARAEEAERALAARDEQLAALQAELEEARREPEPEPEPEEPQPAVAPGRHNLRDLEELVVEAQLRNDPRAEEMAYYVPLFREHAALDGSLPAQFDSLVETVFA